MNMRDRKQFTLIELLCVLAAISILCTMLIGALKTVKDNVEKVACVENLRQMSCGMTSYFADNNNLMPAFGSWGSTTRWSYNLSNNDYIAGDSFECPSNYDPLKPISYGIRLIWSSENINNGVNVTHMDRVSSQLVIADGIPTTGLKQGGLIVNRTHIKDRHKEYAGILFLDGHVEPILRDDLSDVKTVVYW